MPPCIPCVYARTLIENICAQMTRKKKLYLGDFDLLYHRHIERNGLYNKTLSQCITLVTGNCLIAKQVIFFIAVGLINNGKY